MQTQEFAFPLNIIQHITLIKVGYQFQFQSLFLTKITGIPPTVSKFLCRVHGIQFSTLNVNAPQTLLSKNTLSSQDVCTFFQFYCLSNFDFQCQHHLAHRQIEVSLANKVLCIISFYCFKRASWLRFSLHANI